MSCQSATSRREVRGHLTLRFRHEEGADYNTLQKLAYLGVLVVLLPLMVLTGLTMSPAMNAAWPWLLDLFGGRQSARSIHFIVAALLVLFIVVHLVMVVLAGPVASVRVDDNRPFAAAGGVGAMAGITRRGLIGSGLDGAGADPAGLRCGSGRARASATSCSAPASGCPTASSG